MELGMPTMDWWSAHITWGAYVILVLLSIILSSIPAVKKSRCDRIKNCHKTGEF